MVNHAGIVDTMYRALFMSARQIVQKYGNAASDQVKEQAKNPQQAETRHEILHVVAPRSDYDLVGSTGAGTRRAACG